MRHPRLWAIAGWTMVAAIVWLSVTPSPPEIDVENADKLEHLVAYGTLTFWFCQLHAAGRAQLAFVIAFIAMGIALEFVQGALAYRTFDTADMLANTIGAIAGSAVARAVGPGLFSRIERRLGIQ